MKKFFFIPLLSIVFASCSTEDNNISNERLQSKTTMDSSVFEIDDSYMLKRNDIFSQSSSSYQTYYSIVQDCTFPPSDCLPTIVITVPKDLIPIESIKDYITIAELKNEFYLNNYDLIVEYNNKTEIFFYQFQNIKDSSNKMTIQIQKG